MAKNILSQDSRGNYKRDLGWTEDGKQRRFYLGGDKALAQRRSETLERLWELVEARWEAKRKDYALVEEKWRREVERGEWEGNEEALDEARAKWQAVIEAPRWDSVTLAIADAIRKGEPVCTLDHTDHFKSRVDWEKGEIVWSDSSPEAQLAWLRELQQAFPIITLKLADEKKYEEGVTKAQKRQKIFQQQADRDANLAAPREDTQRLYPALDAYSEWIRATYRTPPPESRVKQSGTRLLFHVRKIKEAQENIPLSSFNLAVIEGMIDHWKNRPLTKKGKPSSPDTVKGIIKTIRHFVRWLNRSPAFNWRKPADLEFMPVRVSLDALGERQEASDDAGGYLHQGRTGDALPVRHRPRTAAAPPRPELRLRPGRGCLAPTGRNPLWTRFTPITASEARGSGDSATRQACTASGSCGTRRFRAFAG